MWKGFNFNNKDEWEENYEPQELYLKWKYVNKEEIIDEFIEVAKTLGSEEQLESWLNDVYDTCYAIGYLESLLHDIEDKFIHLFVLNDELNQE